jgi:hypothetical protein
MVSCPGPVLPAGHHVPLTGEGRVIAVLVNAVPPVILSRRNRGTYATGSAEIFVGVALLALLLVIGWIDNRACYGVAPRWSNYSCLSDCGNAALMARSIAY